jgi:hypothetical protein
MKAGTDRGGVGTRAIEAEEAEETDGAAIVAAGIETEEEAAKDTEGRNIGEPEIERGGVARRGTGIETEGAVGFSDPERQSHTSNTDNKKKKMQMQACRASG